MRVLTGKKEEKKRRKKKPPKPKNPKHKLDFLSLLPKESLLAKAAPLTLFSTFRVYCISLFLLYVWFAMPLMFIGKWENCCLKSLCSTLWRLALFSIFEIFSLFYSWKKNHDPGQLLNTLENLTEKKLYHLKIIDVHLYFWF